MTRFIQCSQEKHNEVYNEAVNLEKVAWVLKRDMEYDTAPQLNVYSIVFGSELSMEDNDAKKFYWNYNLKIARDSDYEMIINNKFNKQNVFYPCINSWSPCEHWVTPKSNDIILVDIILSIKKVDANSRCSIEKRDIPVYEIKIQCKNEFHTLSYPLEIQRDSDYEILLKMINER